MIAQNAVFTAYLVDFGDGLSLDFFNGWDGSEDVPEQFEDCARLVELDAVLAAERTVSHVWSATARSQAEEDEVALVWSSSEDELEEDQYEPAPRLTRAQRKALDREIPWRDIVNMDHIHAAALSPGRAQRV